MDLCGPAGPQSVALAGRRPRHTLRRGLGAGLPAYQPVARCYTDAWEAYAAVVPASQHRGGRKGRTNLVEGINNWLRQRCAVLVRKTCSFSKCLQMHHARIKIAIDAYNITLH